jgi:hypothetical protein
MQNLKAIFADVSGASFVGIDTLTTVALTGGKANPHQGRIQKLMKGASVMVFQNKTTNAYENMVKRRLEQEGKSASNFELGPRKWGTRIPNSPIIEHEKDGDLKLYLEVIFLKPGHSEYLLDGNPIAEKDIIGLKPGGEDGGQGGLENKVVIRTFAADSIIAVRIDGIEYV